MLSDYDSLHTPFEFVRNILHSSIGLKVHSFLVGSVLGIVLRVVLPYLETCSKKIGAESSTFYVLIAFSLAKGSQYTVKGTVRSNVP